MTFWAEGVEKMIRRASSVWASKRRRLHSPTVQRKSWEFGLQLLKTLQVEWGGRHERIWASFAYALRPIRSLLWKIWDYWRFAQLVKGIRNQVETVCWSRAWKIYWEVKAWKIWVKETEKRMIVKIEGGVKVKRRRRGKKEGRRRKD